MRIHIGLKFEVNIDFLALNSVVLIKQCNVLLVWRRPRRVIAKTKNSIEPNYKLPENLHIFLMH